MQARAAEEFCHNRSHIVTRITRKKGFTRGKRRWQQHDRGAQSPDTDRKNRANVREHCGRKRSTMMDLRRLEKLLLLSSLRYWEVERDRIEERITAITSVSVPL